MNRGGAGKGKEKEQGTGNREQGAAATRSDFSSEYPVFYTLRADRFGTFGKNPYLWKNRIYKLQKTTIMKRFYLLTALFALTAAGCVKVDLVDAISPSLKI